MKILLRETDGKVWALHPGTERNLKFIIDPTTWDDSPGSLGTGYGHPEGIYWDSWVDARRQLSGHTIMTDDAECLPADTQERKQRKIADKTAQE